MFLVVAGLIWAAWDVTDFGKYKIQESKKERTKQEYIIEVKNEDALIEALAKTGNKNQISYLRSLFSTAKSKSTHPLSRFHLVKASEIAVANLKKNSAILSVTKNIKWQIQQARPVPSTRGLRGLPLAPVPPLNDPFANEQWALKASKLDQLKPEDTNLVGRVMVFVADTWVDANHEDFPSSVNEVVSLLPEGSPQYSIHHFHGTHVTGIITAATNNNRGIRGSLSNVEVFPLEVCDPEGCPLSAIANALIYAADSFPERQEPRVLNMSLGGPTYVPVIAAAVKYAIEKDVSVVAAAGNSNVHTINFYPAAYPGVISVAASSNENGVLDLAWFTNYGDKHVSLVAPGHEILSTVPMEYLNLAETPLPLHQGQAYAYVSGTSMASPLAAAYTAYLRAENPNWTNWQVKEHIEKRSLQKTFNNHQTWKNGTYSVLQMNPRRSRLQGDTTFQSTSLLEENAEIRVEDIEISLSSQLAKIKVSMSSCDTDKTYIRWFVYTAYSVYAPSSYSYSIFTCGETKEIIMPLPLPEEIDVLTPPLLISAIVEDRDQQNRVIGLNKVYFSNGFDFVNVTEMLRPW